MFNITGKTALVTGAGQGIGAGIAKFLADAGAEVYVNDLVTARAEDIAKQIPRAKAQPFDVADYESVKAALTGIDVDILVNNAGIPESMGMIQFKDTIPLDWRPYIDINLYGVLNCTHNVINQMCEKGWGRVITISSGAGSTGLKSGISTYGAGKGGAAAFMRHLAMETARQGVTANTVALGLMQKFANPIADPDSSQNPQDGPQEFSPQIAKLAAATPIGRLGTPADVGAICVYLASPEASWITGQTIHLNGGNLTP